MIRCPRPFWTSALITALLLACSPHASADTIVSGSLNTDATWTTAGSPYRVYGRFTIANGAILAIQPGVVVRFAYSARIDVNGTLIARGTAASKIRFASLSDPSNPRDWDKINFNDSSTDAVYAPDGSWIGGSVLQHVIVEGAGQPDNNDVPAAIRLNHAHPLLDAVTIRNSDGNGIYAYLHGALPATLKIRNSQLTGIPSSDLSPRDGIYVNHEHAVLIENNVVRGYETGIHQLSWVPDEHVGNPVPLPSAVITGNVATGNRSMGLRTALYDGGDLSIVGNSLYSNAIGLKNTTWNGSLTISGNLVRDNSSGGGHISGSPTTEYAVTITDNIFERNTSVHAAWGATAGGLTVESHGPTTVTHNIFNANTDSDDYHAGGVAFWHYGGPLDFSHNLIANNTGNRVSGLWMRASGDYTLTARDNTFTGNLGTGGTFIPPTSTIRIDNSNSGSRSMALHGNNFFGNSARASNGVVLATAGRPGDAIDATGNWWGTTDPVAIRARINTNIFIQVDATAPLSGINTEAPISPPTGLAAGNLANITWNANPEPDVAGYRVWYGPPSDPWFTGTGAAEGSSPIDVGNVTNFQLTGVPADTVVTVTAYDSERDGTNDQTDGHESAYAPFPMPALRVVGLQASAGSTQYPGAPITFTANATGGVPALQYKWLVYDGTRYTPFTGWSTSNTFAWTPSSPNANYRIVVWARSFTSVADAPDGPTAVLEWSYPIFGPISVTSPTTSLPSPQATNTTVAFAATASGGSGSYHYKWLQQIGTTWMPLTGWRTTNTLHFTSAAAADIRLAVWVRNSTWTVDQPDNPLARSEITFRFTTPLPLTINSLTSNLPSPQPVGTPITFSATATGGRTPYQYKWWLFDGRNWMIALDWSLSSTFTWGAGQPGTAYRVGVWVRDATTTTDSSAVNLSVPYVIAAAPDPLRITGLTRSAPTAQVGGSISFQVTAAGGTAPYQYRWCTAPVGSACTAPTPWVASSAFNTSQTVPNNYRLDVWVRSATSTADSGEATTSTTFVFTAPSAGPLRITDLTSDRSSPQAIATPITFSAAVAGGQAPYQYKWWLFDGASWSITRDWSTSATFTWTPGRAGTAYRVGVWVRDATTTTDSGAVNLSAPYVVTAGAQLLRITSLTSSLPSPQPVDQQVTFAVTATGGSGTYQYKWLRHNGATWTPVSGWQTGNLLGFSSAYAADFRYAVWVRNSTSTDDQPDNPAAASELTFRVTTTPSLLTISSLTSSVPSPQATGTTVTFTAAPSGGQGPYTYKWWVFNGSSWTIARDWSSSATFDWTPLQVGGNYRIGVWVRDATMSGDVSTVNLSIPYVALSPP